MEMSEQNITNALKQLIKADGLYLSDISSETNDFESFYLSVRESEKRLLSDKEVARLPLLRNNPHAREWKKRARSAKRVSKYFMAKPSGNLLDLGCGNGWFSSLLAKNNQLEIVGMDVNFSEIQQASRVFHQPNLRFVYGDIFHSVFPKNTFDYITINAVVQYFEDLDLLINNLFELLKPNGEIHFIDSPFYNLEELAGARERTVKYYNEKGFPEMSQYYFHHSRAEISNFDPELLYVYKPKRKILKFFGRPDIPFPWIKIKYSKPSIKQQKDEGQIKI